MKKSIVLITLALLIQTLTSCGYEEAYTTRFRAQEEAKVAIAREQRLAEQARSDALMIQSQTTAQTVWIFPTIFLILSVSGGFIFYLRYRRDVEVARFQFHANQQYLSAQQQYLPSPPPQPYILQNKRYRFIDMDTAEIIPPTSPEGRRLLGGG